MGGLFYPHWMKSGLRFIFWSSNVHNVDVTSGIKHQFSPQRAVYVQPSGLVLAAWQSWVGQEITPKQVDSRSTFNIHVHHHLRAIFRESNRERYYKTHVAAKAKTVRAKEPRKPSRKLIRIRTKLLPGFRRRSYVIIRFSLKQSNWVFGGKLTVCYWTWT